MRNLTMSMTLLCTLILTGCANIVNTPSFSFEKKAVYAVIPFENYTDTPLAGYQVASMCNSVMATKHYHLVSKIWEYSEQDPDKEQLQQMMQLAKKSGSDYIVTGTINEFRYKTGIDGEPAVSITLFVYETKSGKIIWTGSASDAGWSYESLGTVAQKLLNKLIK
jgi:TolB-like protein